MRLRLLFLALLLAGLATSSGGCLAIAVGAGAAGTVAYMRGDLEAEEPYGIEQTYAATRDAVDSLGLKIINGDSGADALSACVTARDSSDKKVVVRLKAVTSNVTKVKVRVGTFGDEAKTRRIYNTIHDRLVATAGGSTQPQETASAPSSQPPATSSEPAQAAAAPSESAENTLESSEQEQSGSASSEPAQAAPDVPASPSP
ncbi:MAG: DUF3568 family protein [Solirubrobacterales bacterium]